MNREGTEAVILLASSLCAGGAACALTLLVLRAYVTNESGGRRIDRGLLYDAGAGRSPLGLFGAYRLGLFFLPLIRRLQRHNTLDMRGRLAGYEAQLVKAGLRPYMTPEHFMALVLLSGLVFGFVMAAVTYLFGFGLVAVVLAFAIWVVPGLILPPFQLGKTVSARALMIEKRLPYATGFILLAMEANASLPKAIKVYCEEVEDDPLADELAIVLSDMEKGLSTQEALGGLDRRLQIDLLSSFILAVNTGLSTGQPIQDIMRVQAAATRRKRYESAEEVAKKASTNATWPLILAVLAAVVLLIGPLMMNFSTNFF